MAWHDTGHVAPLSDTRPVSAVMTARLFAAPPGDAFAADVAGQAARAVWAANQRTLSVDIPALVWAAVARTLTADPGAAAHVVTQDAIADIPAAVLLADAVQIERLERVEKFLRNKQISDPTTGLSTIFEEDGSTPWLQAPIKEDAAGAQAYRRQGIDRRERYVAP
jgi:hypothetical protein